MLDGNVRSRAGWIGPESGAGFDITRDSWNNADTTEPGWVHGTLWQGWLLLRTITTYWFTYLISHCIFLIKIMIKLAIVSQTQAGGNVFYNRVGLFYICRVLFHWIDICLVSMPWNAVPMPRHCVTRRSSLIDPQLLMLWRLWSGR